MATLPDIMGRQKARLMLIGLHQSSSGNWYADGRVWGHPKCTDGHYVTTSIVRSVDFFNKKLVTANTDYDILGLDEEPA